MGRGGLGSGVGKRQKIVLPIGPSRSHAGGGHEGNQAEKPVKTIAIPFWSFFITGYIMPIFGSSQ
jgi:hypothetical protein